LLMVTAARHDGPKPGQQQPFRDVADSGRSDSGGVDAFEILRYLLATLDARAAASHSRMQTSRSET